MFDTKAAEMRLSAIGLTPNEAYQIVCLVQKWARHSGEQWTVDRLKALKLDLLRMYAGQSPLKSHTWVKYHRDGTPKGPFGPVFRLSKKNFGKAWNALMLYTGFVFYDRTLRVSAKQLKKMTSAIERKPVASDALVEGLSMVHRSPFYVPITVKSETGDPLIYQEASETRRAPYHYRTVPEPEGVLASTEMLVEKTVWTMENWDILSGALAGIENLIQPALELNMIDELKSGGPLTEESPTMGVIALIPEPGYKLRFAANPGRIYQAALKPLGDALFAALKRVPNDFTFDQEAGVEFIQTRLRAGKPAVSMDLSNATDNAPLDLQLELLSRLGVSTRWLQFFRSCCRGEWYLNVRKDNSYSTRRRIRWTVGSPLGLYPTFASFALWHHSVVQQCFAEEGVFPTEENPVLDYAILGDDVEILHLGAARRYRERMVSYGIPISVDKTLESDTVGEFAGRIITSNSVVQGIKWKGRATDKSFVDFCRNIGPGALIFLKPRQKAVISYIADLPEPYGLGWNPLGIPLSERLTPTIERLWTRDERLRSFGSRASRANRHLYGYAKHGGGYGKPNLSDLTDVLSDQEMHEVVSELLPIAREGDWMHFAANAVEIGLAKKSELSRTFLERMYTSLQRNSTLERVSETSTLVVLERKIRRVLRESRYPSRLLL